MSVQDSPSKKAARRIVALQRQLTLALGELKKIRQAPVDQPMVSAEALTLANHQFRAPLSTLSNALGLLRESTLSAEQMQWVRAATGSVRNLTYQVNQLSELGELHGARPALEITAASYCDLIEDVADLYGSQARAEGTELLAVVASRAGYRVQVDAARVRQILINMISIALIHARRGRVVLRGDRVKNTVVVEISAFVNPERTSSVSDDRDSTHGFHYAVLEQLSRLLRGRFEVANDGERLRLRMLLPGPLAKQPKDRYVTALREALDGLEIAVLSRTERIQDIAELLKDWGAKVRILETAGAARDLAEGRYLLVDSDAVAVVRSAARRGVVVYALAAQDQPLVPQSEMETLTSFRLPICARETLEMIGAPRLRRYDEDSHLTDMTGELHNASYVLLVEDNMANRLVTARLLERMGHRVHSVADGREAVQAASQIDFDLILMDLSMPVMDGLEATRRILTDGNRDDAPPIVALTAHTEADRRQACLDAGMSAYLVKPVDHGEMVEALRRFGGEGQMRRLRRTSGRHRHLPVIDRGAMVRLRKEVDDSLIPEIGAMFLVELDNRRQDARAKADAEQWPLVPKLLEPLRSSASSFGARQLGALIEQIRSAVSSEELRLAAHYLKELDKVAVTTSRLLREQFSGLRKG